MKTSEKNHMQNVVKYFRFLWELYSETKHVADNTTVDRIFKKHGISNKVITLLVQSGILYFEKHLLLPEGVERMQKCYLFQWRTVPPDILFAAHLLEVVKASLQVKHKCRYCGDQFTPATKDEAFCSTGCRRAHELEAPEDSAQQSWFQRAVTAVASIFH